MKNRRPYPTDVSDEEWYFAAPYLTLMNKDAPQRRYELREMFNALRWIVRAGAPWRLLPNDFPPWEMVYQQTQRWIQAGCFEAMVSDLRSVIRVAQERRGQPSAVIFDGRTLQSTCESGPRAGYDGYKRKRGSKVHMAVDILGQLLAVHVTPGQRAGARAGRGTGAAGSAGHGPDCQGSVRRPGYTGEEPAQAARDEGIELQVIKLPEAKKGFVLLPRRWVVERSFGWLNRFRRLARDYERLPETLAGLHFVVFSVLMLVHFAALNKSA
ncbi:MULTISPECIES: IS5 family transposase [unclassified Paraburkholderia]|uniref:IS5 family transposase n=1 Tax=unclassified Paraburkholderia TaxID=2615204 RepID=UPI001819C9E3|nr:MULTISPECIES: IS5 family transposase [unclassified Paraburkholderia]MBB5443147.1 transposase [Paraburkholderia sp. WSM4177]MBB5483247.1 transposase [Paraburkholderia sp. WSM4180]